MMENNDCQFYSVKSFWCPFWCPFLSSFESRNEEVCNKNNSYRSSKGEQKHVLYQNIKISCIFTICSIRTLFFGRSNTWNHVFQIHYFLSKFFVSRSNGWRHQFKIFLFAIQMTGVICLQFFQCCSNINSIRSKFFRGHSNGTQNLFEQLEHLFPIRLSAIRQPLILTV